MKYNVIRRREVMIDYTKESKLNVKLAVEKLTKDLMENKSQLAATFSDSAV